MPTNSQCDPLSRIISDIAFGLASRPGQHTLDTVAADIHTRLPNVSREHVASAIVEASSRTTRELGDAARTRRRLMSEARKLLGVRRDVPKEQRVARAIEAANKRIAELERRLSAEEGAPNQPKSELESPELARVRAERDSLQKEFQQSVPYRKSILEKQIARLSSRLDNAESAEVATDPASKPTDTKELADLRYSRDLLRRRINRKIQNLRPRTIWDKAADVLNVPRAILSSFDVSALRQGIAIGFAHPIRTSKAFGPMFRALVSPKKAHEISAQIRDRPNARLYEMGKLALADADGEITAREEAYMSRLADMIPGIPASQRAYNAFLNSLRADSFDALIASMTRNGEPTSVEVKAVANFVNVMTGRGNLGRAEQAVPFLSSIFFAPRYMVSRFQILTLQPLYGGTAQTRKLIALEYARTLIGMGIFYALLEWSGLVDIEYDPRSSDFLKIRVGNTRLDPMGGLSQVAVFLSRMASGETKSTTTGRVSSIRGPNVRFGQRDTSDVAKDFVRSKLSPVAGAVWDVTKGEHVMGEPVSVKSVARNLLVPISHQDVSKIMKEHGVPEGSAIYLANLFGIGVQVHEERASKRRNQRITQ